MEKRTRQSDFIPSEILREIDDSYDKDFLRYIGNNHMTLFSNEILDSDSSKIKKYLSTLLFDFKKQKTVDLKISNQKESIVFLPSTNQDFNMMDVKVVIENDIDLLPAIKEVLWQMNNELSSASKILRHIVKIDSDGVFSPLFIKRTDKEHYTESNKVFNMGVFQNELKCEKQKLDKGYLYLYKNPTDKRKGFFYKGKLLSLKDLSNINNVPVITIQKRLARGISLEYAIK